MGKPKPPKPQPQTWPRRAKPTEVFQEWCPVCRVYYPASLAANHSAHTVGR